MQKNIYGEKYIFGSVAVKTNNGFIKFFYLFLLYIKSIPSKSKLASYI